MFRFTITAGLIFLSQPAVAATTQVMELVLSGVVESDNVEYTAPEGAKGPAGTPLAPGSDFYMALRYYAPGPEDTFTEDAGDSEIIYQVMGQQFSPPPFTDSDYPKLGLFNVPLGWTKFDVLGLVQKVPYGSGAINAVLEGQISIDPPSMWEELPPGYGPLGGSFTGGTTEFSMTFETHNPLSLADFVDFYFQGGDSGSALMEFSQVFYNYTDPTAPVYTYDRSLAINLTDFAILPGPEAPAPVPLPATAPLLLAGGLALAALRRRVTAA